MVPLASITHIESGSREKGGAVASGIPSIGGEQIDANGTIRFDKMKYVSEQHFRAMTKGVLKYGDVLLVKDGATTGKCGYFGHRMEAAVNEHVFILRPRETLLPYFLYGVVRSGHFQSNLAPLIKGIIGGISLEIGDLKIPLPPLEAQTEIVAETEGYQKVINGARAVLDNYRPHIPIQPDWPTTQLGDICAFKNGLNFTRDASGHSLKIIGVSNFQNHLYAPLDELDQVHLDGPLPGEYLVKPGDILFVRSNGNPELVGRSLLVPETTEQITFSGFTIRARVTDDRATPRFLAHFFKSRDFAESIKTVGRGANIRNLSQGILSDLKVPLPPLPTQKAIVAEIEAEQELVAANRKLITRLERRIQTTLARVWGETPAAEPPPKLKRIKDSAPQPVGA